jgi:hypothetical protein
MEELTKTVSDLKIEEVKDKSDDIVELSNKESKEKPKEKPKKPKEKRTLYHSLTISSEEHYKIADSLAVHFPNLIFGKKENGVISWENKKVSTDEKDKITEIVEKITSTTLEDVSENDEEEINKKINNGSFLVKTEEGHIYLLNNKFHITLLFTGGKPNEHDEEFANLEENSVNVSVNRVGFSESFFVLGVSIPSEIPYYGNEIKHITVGLRQKAGKFKVLPKDSPTAFSEETDIPVDFVLRGNIEKVLQ